MVYFHSEERQTRSLREVGGDAAGAVIEISGGIDKREVAVLKGRLDRLLIGVGIERVLAQRVQLGGDVLSHRR